MTTLSQFLAGKAPLTPNKQMRWCKWFGHKWEKYGDWWMPTIVSRAQQYQCKRCKKFTVDYKEYDID